MTQKKKEVINLFLNFQLYKDDKLIIDKENIEYQKEENVIHFELDTIAHQLDLEQKTLERYNNEFHFFLDFLNYKCTYELKSHQAVFDIIVDSAFYDTKENIIEMSYAIETDDAKTKIIIKI